MLETGLCSLTNLETLDLGVHTGLFAGLAVGMVRTCNLCVCVCGCV